MDKRDGPWNLKHPRTPLKYYKSDAAQRLMMILISSPSFDLGRRESQAKADIGVGAEIRR